MAWLYAANIELVINAFWRSLHANSESHSAPLDVHLIHILPTRACTLHTLDRLVNANDAGAGPAVCQVPRHAYNSLRRRGRGSLTWGTEPEFCHSHEEPRARVLWLAHDGGQRQEEGGAFCA